MIFETHTLSPPIDRFIESVFHYKDFMPDHSIERVVPTGHIFIIFELDGMQRNTFDNETLKPNGTFTKVWISGMHRNYISISANQKSEMLVIQFKPFGAYLFFHFPIEQLNEKILPAEDVISEELLNLREQIIDKETSSDKFLVAEEWLNKRFDLEKAPTAELLTVLENLQSEPCSNYKEAIKGYPNTQKHLIDQFKKYIGLTPKYYQRILRFHEIFQEMQKEKGVAWPKIAYQCGFSDQSHFIKEFKHFSGFNPQEFIQQDYSEDEQNFFLLDREK